MKRHILIVSVILTALLAASCSVYHPQMVDVPLLHHKGDGHIDLGMSMQWLGVPTSAEWNLSASYAPTDWLALQAAGVYDMSKTGFAQAAVGSYLPWDNFVLEGYIGGGAGYAYSGTEAEDNGDEYVEGSYSIAFAQFDLGWVSLLSGHLDFGAGIKGGFLFPSFTDYGKVSNMQRTTQSYNDPHTFFEPQVMLRVGGEHLKVVGRLALTEVFCKGDAAQFVYSPVGISLGLNYRF
ncbi:MAG: hypothetical protein IJU90_01125 [Bacteroidales bacterium]|nr:hypothetical protein [Bacteroidales bacterium]